jgi:hypothetical protein
MNYNKKIGIGILLILLISVLSFNAFADLYLNSRSGHINLNTTGQTRLQITPGGNLNLLALSNVSIPGNLSIGGNVSVDGNTLFVDSNDNRVGVGTTAPEDLLHVNKSQDASTNIRLQNANAGSSAYSQLYVINDGGSGVSFGIGSSGTTANVYADRGFVVTDSALNGVSIIAAGSGDDIRLFTGGSAAGNERVRIDDSGNVGIGNTNPNREFTVNGDIATNISSGGQSFRIINDSTTLLYIDYSGGDVYLSNQQSGKLFLRTAATERATIDANGNVGIGTASPISLLHVNNGDILVSESGSSDPLIELNTSLQEWIIRIDNSDDDKLQILDQTHSDLVVMTFENSTGNVGIGTTEPGAKLEVNSVAATSRVAIFKNPGAAWDEESNFLLTTGDSAQGQGAIAWKNRDVGATRPSQLQFRTIASDAEPTVKMVVTGGGNVGIGTTSPSALLTVNTSTGQGSVDIGEWSSSSNYGFISFNGKSGTSSNFYGTDDGHLYINRQTDSEIRIRENNSDQMVFLNGGNVGINDSSPDATLEVVGNLMVTNSSDGDLLTVLNSGSVGIGTASPNGKLNIKGGSISIPHLDLGATATGRLILDPYMSGQAYAKISTGANEPLYLSVGDASTHGAVNALIIASPSGNVGIGTTGPGAPLHINTTGASTLYLDSSHANGPYLAWRESGADKFYIGSSEAVGTGSGFYDIYSTSGDGLRFFTNAAESVRIQSNGHVGIGTASPKELLDIEDGNITISSSGSYNPHLLFADDSGMSVAGLDIWYQDDIGNSYIDNVYDNAAGDIHIRTKTAGTPIEALFIESAGNIGIGTTSPTNLLHLNSTANNAIPLRMSNSNAAATNNNLDIIYDFKDSAGNHEDFAQILVTSVGTTDGSEQAEISFFTTSGNAVLIKEMKINSTGVYADDSFNNNAFDYAEYHESVEQTQQGEIVALVQGGMGKVKKATKDDKWVFGVVSLPHAEENGTAGFIGGKGDTLVAYLGRVPVKVKGAVEFGDYIGVSEQPGIGKVVDYLTSIRVIETNNNPEIKKVMAVAKINI